MNPACCGASAHIGHFELPRTSVSGHHGRTGEVLDEGATVAGSSDENLGLVSGMSACPLAALRHVGKATPLFCLKNKKAFGKKPKKKFLYRGTVRNQQAGTLVNSEESVGWYELV